MKYSKSRGKAKKCNSEARTIEYLPSFFKLRYDPLDDNRFPYALDPDYWIKVLQYYVRKFKYAIETFFWPWEVQIVTVTMNQESLIS